MASRELVGRPLVPFFDADDNLNAALAVDASSAAREPLDVDARVWNKELGYFEYPSEPIAIPGRQEAARTLLTPAMMLSSSCPEPSAALGGAGAAASSAPGSNGRSSSSKRGAKQKRAATPNAKSSGKQSATDSAGDAAKAGRKRSGKAGKPKGKEELSAAGKWAWSAFQSSPDPNELPLPPFLAKSAAPAPPAPPPLPPIDPLMYPASPPRTYSQVAQGITPPFQPPLPPNPPPEEPMSIELSMTQDLRRMLNIGGG